MIHVDKAEAVLDVMEEYTVKVTHLFLHTDFLAGTVGVQAAIRSQCSPISIDDLPRKFVSVA